LLSLEFLELSDDELKLDADELPLEDELCDEWELQLLHSNSSPGLGSFSAFLSLFFFLIFSCLMYGETNLGYFSSFLGLPASLVKYYSF